MTHDQLREMTQAIVAEARSLSAKHTDESDAPVNYACIFAQSEAEFAQIEALAHTIGPVVEETKMGPVFAIPAIPTVAGPLSMLKVRRPDPKRPERGDADFTVSNYDRFKATHIGKPGFGLITRPEMEMIELSDPTFNVLAYYSHPTLAEVIRQRGALPTMT